MAHAPTAPNHPGAPLVLDSNIALDLLLFADPAVQALHRALQQGQLRWLATPPMRQELARVLAYPALHARLAASANNAEHILAAFDQLTQPLLPPAPPAAVRCTDPDDQMFIDLAVAERALLLSKDQRVLACAKAMARLGGKVAKSWVPAA